MLGFLKLLGPVVQLLWPGIEGFVKQILCFIAKQIKRKMFIGSRCVDTEVALEVINNCL